MDDIYTDFWETFLEETGTPENTVMQNCTYFGNSEEESVEILEQLLRGEKTAVGHCVAAYLATNQRMPKVGDYGMVTDYYGNPCCILHTLEVTIEPLPDIPAELRQAECPGLSGETWLARKQQEFQDLSRRFGFHFHPELPLLMETVEKVYPV